MIRSIIAAVYLTLLSVLGGPLLLLYSLIVGSTELLYRWGVGATLFVVRAIGVRTRVEGLENIPAGTCLFVANHTSNIDPPVIVGATPRRIAILAKKSLFSIPIVGKAFRTVGWIPVDRSAPAEAKASLDLAAESMKQGFSFLIYPEGTRSRTGRLLPFKHGGFALAIKSGVPVVPVACIGAQHILPKGSLRISPGEIVVRFCTPIDATAYPMTKRAELSNRVYAAIAEALPPEQKPEVTRVRPSRA